MGWTFIGSATNDNFIIDGVDVFNEKWTNTAKIANVIDPIYGQKFKFTVWQVKNLQFAAGEFSNNGWGIYIDK